MVEEGGDINDITNTVHRYLTLTDLLQIIALGKISSYSNCFKSIVLPRKCVSAAILIKVGMFIFYC